MSLGAFANALALRNASGRLPGREPNEGELHVRFGEGLQETSRRKGFRACFLLHTICSDPRRFKVCGCRVCGHLCTPPGVVPKTAVAPSRILPTLSWCRSTSGVAPIARSDMAGRWS